MTVDAAMAALRRAYTVTCADGADPLDMRHMRTRGEVLNNFFMCYSLNQWDDNAPAGSDLAKRRAGAYVSLGIFFGVFGGITRLDHPTTGPGGLFVTRRICADAISRYERADLPFGMPRCSDGTPLADQRLAARNLFIDMCSEFSRDALRAYAAKWPEKTDDVSAVESRIEARNTAEYEPPVSTVAPAAVRARMIVSDFHKAKKAQAKRWRKTADELRAAQKQRRADLAARTKHAVAKLTS